MTLSIILAILLGVIVHTPFVIMLIVELKDKD